MRQASNDELIETARQWVDASRRIVVLTGAGISTDSGIPDFRGPQGVWTRNPGAERLATLEHYLGDADARRTAWQGRLHHPAWSARPNAGHRALVHLEQRGLLHALVTQNIDELHQSAGNSPERVVELHGTMRRVVCWSCRRKGPMQPVLDRVRAGELDPRCGACGGILKSDTISFGQPLEPEVLQRAARAAREADLLIAIGTSLQVYPAAGIVPLAREAGARLVISNAQPTPFDASADAVIRTPIGESLPRICGVPAI